MQLRLAVAVSPITRITPHISSLFQLNLPERVVISNMELSLLFFTFPPGGSNILVSLSKHALKDAALFFGGSDGSAAAAPPGGAEAELQDATVDTTYSTVLFFSCHVPLFKKGVAKKK